MTANITTDKLSKTYAGDKAPALDGLTLEVKAGEVYGYLGANGAGKSTTIRLLMNFIQPSSGSALIAGLDSVKNAVEVKKRVGYLSGDVALYQKTTGRHLLNYLAALQGGVDADYRRKLEQRFEAQMDKPIESLSKGNRQKIGILQALMHRPEVLILDEPTSGLDPLMQEVFYDSIREARSRGAAVLMSSHNLDEAQRICDRVGIIKHGKLIREQSLEGEASLGQTIFQVTLSSPSALPQLKKAAHLKFLDQAGSNTARMQLDGTIAEALKSLSHFDIREIKTEQSSLEDEFIEFYGSSE